MTPEEKKVLEAAQSLLSWVEATHRPPVRDELEIGRMVLVRLHALADLHDAISAANAVSEPVGINGLTEAETNATMSVMGLRQPQPQECKDCGQSTKQDLIHTCSPQVSWPQCQPIATAAKDGTVVMVNDVNVPGWVAANWLDGVEWAGWVYDNELLNDAFPLGPQPTHWISMPPAPEAA